MAIPLETQEKAKEIILAGLRAQSTARRASATYRLKSPGTQCSMPSPKITRTAWPAKRMLTGRLTHGIEPIEPSNTVRRTGS